MSPGGGDSVAGAALAAAVDGACGAVGALLELLELLHAAARSPAAARTRIRRLVTTALVMSMPGR